MKKNFNKYTVCALLFFAVIFVTAVGTVTTNLKDIRSSLQKATGLYNKVNTLEAFYDEKLICFDNYIALWGASQLASGATLYDDSDYGYIIKDKQNKFHFPVYGNNIFMPVLKTKTFAHKLKRKNVPFVYVQAPDKMLAGYTVFPRGALNKSNENADDFLKALKKDEISTFDLRKKIVYDDLDRDSLFYITDHHWTTPTAFWAFNELCDYLNDSFSLGIDNNNYYRDINNYNTVAMENCFLGSLGRRVGPTVCGYDDYVFIEPNFETEYLIFDGKITYDSPVLAGSFRDCIVKENILYSDDKTANKHATYFEWDHGDLIIRNELIDNDLNILLIKDSFSLPLAAFLSTCVKELHMVDLRDKAVIPYEYIDKFDFDAVIMLYNTEVFAPPMFNLTNY